MIDYPHNCTILYYEDEKIYKYWKIKLSCLRNICYIRPEASIIMLQCTINNILYHRVDYK